MARARLLTRLQRLLLIALLGTFGALALVAMPASAALGSIDGTVYDDLNNNTVEDLSETGHGFVTVFLDLNVNGVYDSGEPTTTTDGTGAYSFTGLANGTYRVIISVPTNYAATTPNPLTQVVSGGANVVGADFGVSNVSAINGTAFNDVNGNSLMDSGDAGVSGKTVYLDTNGNGSYTTGEPTATTDSYGYYSFTGLAPAQTVRTRIIVPNGSQQTTAQPATIVTAPGSVNSNFNFGLFIQGVVAGTVYNDVNADGDKDVGDGGLTTKVVFLDANANGTKDTGEVSATTGTGGTYAITGIGPGSYTPVLVLATGTIQTTTSPGVITVTSGYSQSSVDFGQFTLGTISGMIYNDTNASGSKDTSETGVSGKTVYLDSNGNGTLDLGEPNTNTNGTGGYTFTNMAPGTYNVRLVPSANYTQTSTNPATINMTSSMTAANTNIGVYQSATLSGTVYDDVNGNGSLGAGEGGVSGVTVYLDANNSGSLDTGETATTTSSTGTFSFTGLTPGTYRSRIVLPSNTIQTSTNPAAATPTSGATITNNFGTFQLATVGGSAYDDTNGNGSKGFGEPGLSGLTVFLDANSNNQFDLGESSAVTNGTGAWSVSGLSPGTYKPRVVVPNGMTVTSTLPAAIVVTSNMNNTASNFGLFSAASIAGSAFSDFDGDGARQLGEAGLSGRTVFLDANNDGTISTGETTTSTDQAGNFIFTGLGPGTYIPRVSLGTGVKLTSPLPAFVVTTSGLATTDIEFGLFTTASISGTIYNDVDGDGVKEAGEAGIASRVAYLDANNNGTKDTGETNVTTANGGGYTFTGLGPGTFRVRLVVASGTLQTSSDPAPITTTSGSSSGGNDFGSFTLGSIAGTVYNDVNGSATKQSTEAGLAGKTVYIDADGDDVQDTGELTAVTASSGAYSFTGLVAGAYKVRLAQTSGWQQTNTDPATITISSASAVVGTDFGVFALATITGTIYDDTNGNGSKNLPGELGIAGRTVYLDTNANSTLDSGEVSTTTDSSGNYAFGNLPAGTYRPRVVIPTNAKQTTATLPLVTTASGTISTGNDLGLFTYGVINGSVFVDTNGNGIKDTTETGTANLRVYNDSNSSNTYNTGEASTLTDTNGDFSLDTLTVGTYKPRLVLPTGTLQSTAAPATVTVVSGTSVSGVLFGTFVPGSITGLVFNDTNGNGLRDTGDSGLSGKTIYIDANANGVKDSTETSVTTSTTGTYTLSNLNAGSYLIRQVVISTQVQTTSNPAAILMTSGLTTTGLDFGVRTPPPPGVVPPAPFVPPPPSQDAQSQGSGYWMTSADGNVFAYGGAGFYGAAAPYRPTSPVVGFAPTVSNLGYYQVARDGGIFAFGDAKFYGSMGGRVLNKPMVGIAVTPSGKGYWTVATDGGVFCYGDATFYGSTGALALNQPIVQIVPTSTGKGYWLVAADGGIFSYGDARFFGSTGSFRLNKPIVGMARAANDQGYWMVASDGGIFAFGTAPFYGSMGSLSLNQPIVAIKAPSSGDGYWLVARDGGIFAYGSARYFGGTPGIPSPIVQ